jgi:hypothetical protein
MTKPQSQQQLQIISDSFKLIEKQVEQMKHAEFVDVNAARATIYEVISSLRGLDSQITRLASQITGPFPK